MFGICACKDFSLSYIVLALSKALTNLLNKTLIFYDFQGQLNSVNFQA